MPSADITRTADRSGTPAPGSGGPGAPVALAIALSGLLALAGFALIAPILRAILPSTGQPEPLPNHHQDAETLIFLLTFGLLLPLAVVFGPRIADRIAATVNRDAFSALVAALTTSLALILLLARASSAAGLVLGAGAAIWLIGAGLLLGRAADPSGWRTGERLAPLSGWLWLLAAILVAGSALAFSSVDSISLPVLAIGALLVVAALLARERVGVPEAPRRLGPLADAAAIGLLLLAVPNLAIFASGGGVVGAIQTTIIQFHQNFFLGPANQILHGDAMLVDTLSQYGVGSIYFLAGLFNLIPIGNSSLALIEGVLSALMFIGAWLVMRIAGVGRLLAASAMLVAVIALVYGLQYPLGGLLQHGAFRFGLPIGVLVGAVAESRWPQAAGPARFLQLLTIAVASIWALEAFAYTALTLIAVVAVSVSAGPAGQRGAALRRWGLQVLASVLLAHLLLAGITLAARGELPDWGWYLNTLREFLFGQIGEITYDFSPWSPGLAVGILYLLSAAAVAVLIRRRPDLLARERTMLIAISGMTAFGIALFSYLVNRSTDHIVPYVCLPAVTLGALWISLLERPVLAIPAAGRRVAWALGLAVSVLLIAVAASSVDTRFHQSALAYARPGGTSLWTALERIWGPPPVWPPSVEGERLLDEEMPGRERSAVITSTDLGIEILIRSGRGSSVPLGDAWEDSFVPDDHLAPLGEYVDGLQAGDRILIDPVSRKAFELYRREPGLNPLPDGISLVTGGLAALQKWTLKEIGKRFDLRTVATSPSGLEVVELVPRGSGPG